jgi:phosphinothricin acetyltransferase
MSMPTIRSATAADLPDLLEIYNHYVLQTPITFDVEPISMEQRRVWLQQFAQTGRHRLWVAESAGRLVGYAGTHQFRAKQAYEASVETTIYCAPGAQGRGIGRALYDALFEALRAEDIRSFIAGITLPNPASIALHQRVGFTLSGTMHAVGRKFGSYWDVAWYEKVVSMDDQLLRR